MFTIKMQGHKSTDYKKFSTASSDRWCHPLDPSKCAFGTLQISINPLAPNDVYIRRTAQLNSRRCILNIYSTNILTEYFKHAAHPPFFFFFKMPFIS